MESETKLWEYKAVTLGSFWTEPKDSDIETALNQLGLEGWEVFSIVTQYGTSKVRAFARRPLDPDARAFGGRWSR